MALAAASLCVGTLRKGLLMPPPASPCVTTGHLDWSWHQRYALRANPNSHPGGPGQDVWLAGLCKGGRMRMEKSCAPDTKKSQG